MKKTCTTLAMILLALCLVMTAHGESADLSLMHGKIRNASYENVYFGIGCTLEDWDYTTLTDGNEQTRLFISASYSDGLYSMNMVAQNLEGYLETIEATGLRNIIESTLEQQKATYDYPGVTDLQLAVDDITIGGRTLPCVVVNYNMSGYPVYSKQPAFISGNYMVTITVTTLFDDMTDEILSSFYFLPQ